MGIEAGVDSIEHGLGLEAEHADLIENVNDVMFTLDREGRITSINRAGERLTGYTRGEIIGRTLQELCDPDTDRNTLASSASTSRTFELAIRTLFESPTVAGIAAHLPHAKKARPSLTKQRRSDPELIQTHEH